MVKYCLFTLFTLLLPGFVFAQKNGTESQTASRTQPEKPGAFISSEYDRCGLTYILLDFDREPRLKYLHNPFREKVSVEDKFFDNRIPDPVWNADPAAGQARELLPLPALARPAAAALYQNRIANQVLDKIFESDGKAWHLESIFKRARYNLTDDQVRILENSAQGKSAGSEGAKYSEKVLRKTFIVAYSVRDIQSYQEYYDAQDEKRRQLAARSKGKIKFTPVNRLFRGYKARLSSWCFKIDMNDSILDLVWTHFDNKARRDSIVYPLLLAGSFERDISVQDPLRNPLPVPEEELFRRLAVQIFSGTTDRYEDMVPDFRVRTPIISTDPITAKIGLKEGLRLDQRYMVYENQMKNGRLVSVRKGVVRAGLGIQDNRSENSGSTTPSRFYQVAGRRLYPGMLMEQKNDLGISVLIGSSLPVLGANRNVFNFRLSGNLSRIYNPYGTRKFPSQVRILLDFDVYHKAGTAPADSLKEFSYYDFDQGKMKTATGNAMVTLAAGIGVMRDYHFGRVFRFSPFAVMGFSKASYTDAVMDSLAKRDLGGKEKRYGGRLFIKAGCDLGMNIVHNTSLVFGLHTSPIGYRPDWKPSSDPDMKKSSERVSNRIRSTVQVNVKLRFDL